DTNCLIDRRDVSASQVEVCGLAASSRVYMVRKVCEPLLVMRLPGGDGRDCEACIWLCRGLLCRLDAWHVGLGSVVWSLLACSGQACQLRFFHLAIVIFIELQETYRAVSPIRLAEIMPHALLLLAIALELAQVLQQVVQRRHQRHDRGVVKARRDRQRGILVKHLLGFKVKSGDGVVPEGVLRCLSAGLRGAMRARSVLGTGLALCRRQAFLWWQTCRGMECHAHGVKYLVRLVQDNATLRRRS